MVRNGDFGQDCVLREADRVYVETLGYRAGRRAERPRCYERTYLAA